MLESIAKGSRIASLIGAGLLAAGFLRVGIGLFPLRDRTGLVVRHLVVHAGAVLEDDGRTLTFILVVGDAAIDPGTGFTAGRSKPIIRASMIVRHSEPSTFLPPQNNVSATTPSGKS